MNLLETLLQWGILWSAGWFLWIFLLKRGVNYVNTYRLTVCYFLSFSIFGWYMFHSYLSPFFHQLPPKILPYCILAAFFITSIIIYQKSRKSLEEHKVEKHKQELIFFATMDYRFLFSKSFDIFFQQLLFLSLVLILRSVTTNSLEIMIACAGIFGTIHIPLLVTKHNVIAPYFIFASFVAGAIFSALILCFSYGFLYSYIIHWSFYILAGLLFNRRRQKNFTEVSPL